MLRRLSRLLLGRVVFANNQGWTIKAYRRGLFVSPPLNRAGVLHMLGPASFCSVYIGHCWLSGNPRLLSSIAALPFLVLIGCYYLRPATLYVNTAKRTVMSGDFKTIVKLAETTFMESEHAGDRWLCADLHGKPCLVWKAETEEELRRVGKLLQDCVSSGAVPQ